MNWDKRKLIPVVIVALVTMIGLGAAIFNSFIKPSLNISEETAEQQDIDTYETNIINISNLDDVSPNSNPTTKLDAQRSLYKYAAKQDASKTSYDAEVRAGSFSQSTDSNYTIDRMIVDIPELKQSWGLIYVWSNKGPVPSDHIFPTCLEESEMKYGAFDCQSNYGKYKDF